MEIDTIVAIVTPPGEGGVGIVRASGPLSNTLSRRLFPDLPGAWTSHHMRFGRVAHPGDGHTIDEALGVLMCGPRSYTGEDVFEIQAHGSPLVLEQIVGACVREGCRQARPGEFTLRAFMNGRLDLSRAEAVLDVVRARSNVGLALAVDQMRGSLYARVEPTRGDLVGLLAHVEAMVDFVEDDVPPQPDPASLRRLSQSRDVVAHLLTGAEQGIVLRQGVTLAIVGSPNVGKSSIMNGLLGSDRSIVTSIAGTTRDTVEEQAEIGGVPFRAVDTAGITETPDEVERIGVQRSKQAIGSADVVLFVVDGSRPWSTQDEMTLHALHDGQDAEGRRPVPIVLAVNKSDLGQALDLDRVQEIVRPDACVETSAITPDGLDALRAALARAAVGEARGEYVLGNVRHQEALYRALQALDAARAALNGGTPLDLVSFDIRAAVQALGEITGANVDDELLDRIFRDFCIGK